MYNLHKLLKIRYYL